MAGLAPIRRGGFPSPIVLALTLMSGVALGCSEGTGPGGIVEFTDHDIDIGLTQSGALQVVNRGSEAAANVRFSVLEVADTTGLDIGGATLEILRSTGVAMAPDEKLGFSFRIVATRLPPGSYGLTLGVSVDDRESDRALIRWGKTQRSATRAHRLVIHDPRIGVLLPGDTVRFSADAFAVGGQPVHTQELRWYVVPVDAGRIDSHGVFVASEPGVARVIAAIGNTKDEREFRVLPLNPSLSLEIDHRAPAPLPRRPQRPDRGMR